MSNSHIYSRNEVFVPNNTSDGKSLKARNRKTEQKHWLMWPSVEDIPVYNRTRTETLESSENLLTRFRNLNKIQRVRQTMQRLWSSL